MAKLIASGSESLRRLRSGAGQGYSHNQAYFQAHSCGI